MIIVNVKENESIDKALKRFKKKFEKTNLILQKQILIQSLNKTKSRKRTEVTKFQSNAKRSENNLRAD